MPLAGNRYALAMLWLLVTVILAAVSAQQWRAGVPLDADLFSLLPAEARDPVVQRATQVAERALNRTTLAWVSSAEPKQLVQDVTRVAERLRRSGLFSAVVTGPDALGDDQISALLPWRFNLVSPAIIERLQTENGTQQFFDTYLHTLMSPIGVGPVPLQQDIFGLTNQWLQSLPVPGPALDTSTGLWTGMIDGKPGAFVILFDQSDAFSLGGPEAIAGLLDAIRHDEAPNGVQIIASGAALFAASAATQAKGEISTVGVGSAIAALVLILWVFRSPRGWLTLLPVVYGSWLALLACDLVFGKVHLMTLVFGASLTGVSIDYALHVMADAFQTQGQWSAGAAIRKLLPGLTLGMLTSVMAYACLALAPFPGLQQVAVFSGVSLFAAYLMVILLFPLLLTGFQRKHQPLLLKALGVILRWRDRVLHLRIAIFASFALVAIGGVLQLQPQDDIRQLYATDARLQRADDQLRAAFGLKYNSQFILVRASTEEELLAREQQILQALAPLAKAGQLGGYNAIVQWLPPASTQLEHQALLEQRIFGTDSPLRAQLLSLGFNDDILSQQWQSFAQQRGQTLSTEQALSLPVAAPWRSLWLGHDENGVASRISLRGVNEIDIIETAIKPIAGAQLIDRVADISSLLGQYRQYTSYLIVLALVATWLLLVPRYGIRQGLFVVVAPGLAILLTVGLHGWLHVNFNLFSLFGFLIVLGMGVDYAIYFEESHHHADADPRSLQNTALGITLDALTTLFSFGLLSVSSTPAVSAFGTSVLLGITFSWLFAHLVGQRVTAASPFHASQGVSHEIPK